MSRKRRKTARCPNCGQALAAENNFCPNCGQENHDLRVPFRHLLSEALEGVLHFDSKSYRTIVALLFRPGFLTVEFSKGRRAGYVAPIRLYIFLSFLFFLLLSIRPKSDDTEIIEKQTIQTEIDSTASSGSIIDSTTIDSTDTDDFDANEADSDKAGGTEFSFFSINSKVLKGMKDAQIDSVLMQEGVESNKFTRYLAKQLGRILRGGSKEFNHNLVKSISYMMFVLMPLFALILYIFYRKRAGYYLNCLVFSLHFHSFIFLLFTIYLVVNWIVAAELLILAILFLVGVYLYFSLKKVYDQSRLWTLLKLIFIGALHIFSFLLCLLLLIIANVLLF